jgi:hypothetical protein
MVRRIPQMFRHEQDNVNATETRMYQRSVGWDSPDLDRVVGICKMISEAIERSVLF